MTITSPVAIPIRTWISRIGSSAFSASTVSRIAERGADGALGVVLVRDRHAEVRDDRVADVLLDRAAAALELGAEAGVVELEQREHVLRVELLGERGRADEVDEDERVELALLVDDAGGGAARPRRAASRS